MEIHVSKKGNDQNSGTVVSPFVTISRAAACARPGDHVIVHEGIYREAVDPVCGGNSHQEPIVYEAACGENVVIKGSEQVIDWKQYKGTTWYADIPNDIFHGWNPFEIPLNGDWLVAPYEHQLHLGEVYMNGKAFYEAATLDAVLKGAVREHGEKPFWMTWGELDSYDIETTKYQWYSEIHENYTKIYANFHNMDPNKELIEINVRPHCFYPSRAGINYITVRGFEMEQAATQWAPPTANQPGLIGTHRVRAGSLKIIGFIPVNVLESVWERMN